MGLKGRLRQPRSVRALFLLSLLMILATVIWVTAVRLDLRQKELAHARCEIVSLTRIFSGQTTRGFEGLTLITRGARERISDDNGRHFDCPSRDYSPALASDTMLTQRSSVSPIRRSAEYAG